LTKPLSYQDFNPFRRPTWRLERVLHLVDQQPPARCTKDDDRYVRQARTFWCRHRAAQSESAKNKLFRENPGLFYAYEIHERSAEEPETAYLLQARILARQDDATIASYLATLPQTVDWYEKVFFNVRDRLDQRDWITKHVLVPAFLQQALPAKLQQVDSLARPFLDGTLKLFAYFGGPVVLDVMISGFEQRPLVDSNENLAAWLDEQWSLAIRRRSYQSALSCPINKFNVMDLFSVHAQIISLAQREDSPSQQRTLLERHIQSLLDDLPFATGTAGVKMVEATPLASYEEEAAELRDQELFAVQHGQSLRRERLTSLPPPRRRSTAAVQEEHHARNTESSG